MVILITIRFDIATMLNANISDICSTHGNIRPFIRDNSTPLMMKRRPYYMIDSSYTVACNPNSMRDSGPLRNAEYVVADPAE